MVSGLALGQEDLKALHHHEFGRREEMVSVQDLRLIHKFARRIASGSTRSVVQEPGHRRETSPQWAQTLVSRSFPASTTTPQGTCRAGRSLL